MTYAIFIERRAQRSLSRIAAQDRDRISGAIRHLAEEPRPKGVKKLSGRDAWRIRVGDYRVIYEIRDERLSILVVDIGHRREIDRFDRVGLTGLRPPALPHHRTCGFPHPAVEPSGLCPQASTEVNVHWTPSCIWVRDAKDLATTRLAPCGNPPARTRPAAPVAAAVATPGTCR